MNEQDRMRLEQETKEMEQRILNIIKQKFPVKVKDKTIDLKDLQFVRPPELFSLSKQHELKAQNGTLAGKLKGKIVVYDKNGKKIEESRPYQILNFVPYKTHRGSYIVSGNEKTISSQMRLAPGIYTEPSGQEIVTRISFDNKSGNNRWIHPIEVHFNPNNYKFYVKVKSGGKDVKINGITFLTDVLGATPQEVRKALGTDEMYAQIRNAKNTYAGGVQDVYKSLFPNETYNGSKEQIQKMRSALFQETSFGFNGDKRIAATTGVKSDRLTKQVALAAIEKLFNVARNIEEPDDKDDLRFKYVLNDYDLIEEEIEKGLDNFVREIEKRIDRINREEYGVKGVAGNAVTQFNKTINDFMKGRAKSAQGIVENPEETNPLQLLSAINKVTQLGPGGLPKKHNLSIMAPRNLQNTAVTRIDPFQTPESTKIGLTLNLAHNARVANRTILSKFYKVNNGVAKTGPQNEVELDPFEEYDSYVAFYNPSEVTEKDGQIVLKNKEISGRYKGKLIKIPKEKVQYIDTKPSDILGYAASLIPFGNHNDGNRMLMGTNMQQQALLLDRSVREAPLVQVAVDKDKKKTFEEIMAEKANAVYSPVNGVVTDVRDDKITIKDDNGKNHEIEIYNYFPLNQDNFINNEPVVKVGDRVKKGQLLADGWQTKDGKLALGVNARVAYLPFNGWNYEDGVVVSKQFAERMRTEEIDVREIPIKKGYIGGPNSKAKEKLIQYTNVTTGLSKLDDDGIIKQGQEVGPGDMLVAILAPKDKKFTDPIDELTHQLIKGSEIEYSNKSAYIGRDEYIRGKVLDVTVLPGSQSSDPEAQWLVRVRIKTSKPLKLGDKISGRHGNKGTITKILDESQMPKTEDGKPIDLIFSPLAVPSRKNVGQLLEVNAGLIAEKTGKPFKVYNFDPKEKDKVLKSLEKIGIPDGKVKVIDPETGKPYENPVTVGNMYIMKLKHKVDDKLQARSAAEGRVNLKYLSPEKIVGEAAGEKANPQRLGEMEMWALQANQAPYNILESTTLKGDGAGFVKDRVDIFRAIALGDKKYWNNLKKKSAVPESLKILRDNMFAMGAKVTPLKNNKPVKNFDETFDELLVTPAKDEEILKIIGAKNKVTNKGTYQARRLKGDLKYIPQPGGLYDPEIFGDEEQEIDRFGYVNKEMRNKWGYIELPTPIPNPILLEHSSYNPYKELLGYNKNQLTQIMTKPVVVVTNPGDSGKGMGEIISASEAEALEDAGKNFEYKVGGEALMYLLSKIDVDKELNNVRNQLKDSSLSVEQKNRLYKKYRILENLKNNNLKPTDFMTKIVPVVPRYLRPRIEQGKQVINDGLTALYSNVIDAVKGAEASLEFAPLKDQTQQIGNIYKAVKQLYGVGASNPDVYVDKQGNKISGITELIGGKEGLVRDRMLGKRVDYSGRAVIGVDPTLGLNEVAIPPDMAKRIYRPFIIQKLIEGGYVKPGPKGEAKAKEKIKNMDQDVRKVLEEIAKERPVLINRAPTLHKFSIQAFTPKIKYDGQDGEVVRNIQLNPLVVTGFNADFDGDQMAVHAPISPKAVEEAKKLMMPSENLINPKDGSMIIEIRHEMALGVYYLTMNADKMNGKPKKFDKYEDLLAAYKNGDIRARDAVTYNNKTATAGQWLFFGIIPEPYRQQYFGQAMDKSKTRKLLRQMYDDIIEKKSKMGLIDLSNIIDKIKDIGFLASTKSGMSIGVKDLQMPADMAKSFEEAVKKVDEEVGKDESKLIAGYQKIEEMIEDKLKAGALGENNPATLMMQSGARGNPNQVRRMAVTVGLGRDIMNKTLPPIRHSHLDGLSPDEFWFHGFDSRKGMADRVLSTAKPGEMTRQLWSLNQSAIISEKDCGTKDGIKMHKESKIVGRYAAKDIVGENGTVYVKAGNPIKLSDAQAIAKDQSITMIEVRSPATCKTVNGICQKCYGWEPGKPEPPKLGTPVGVIAAQSLGEPITQMTMETFHGGGTSSNVTLGLPRIVEILHPTSKVSNQAVLASVTGTVKEIIEKPRHTEVIITPQEHGQKDRKHIIPLDENGNRKPLRVRRGDFVQRGDFLTVGDIPDILNPPKDEQGNEIPLTNASPAEILKYTPEGPEQVKRIQDYMVNTMQYAIDKSLNKSDAIDRRHIELTVGKLTENVIVTDASTSPFIEGQTVKKAEVDRWNAQNASLINAKYVKTSDTQSIIGHLAGETYKDKNGNIIVKQGDTITRDKLGQLMLYYKKIKVATRPVKYTSVLHSATTAPVQGHDNWFSNLGHQAVREQIARGVSWGQKDKLEDPRARLMAGKLINVGQGWDLWNKAKDVANSFTNSLVNMFKRD